MIPSAMPPSSAARCAAAELLVGLPLQPLVERDAVGQLARERGDERGRRVAGLERPLLVLRSARPGRTRARTSPDRRPPARRSWRTRPAGRPSGALRRRPRGPPAWPSRRRLGRSVRRRGPWPAPVPRPTRPACGPPQTGTGLAHVLDPDVDRVHEPARGWQVRRRGHRHGRLSRVQRVDEQEVGAELAAGQPADLREVRQVPDAPRGARADRVELRHEPPGPVPADRVGHVEVRRGHDERAVRVGGRAAGDDLVPAERQVVGQRERRAAHQAPVDRPRVGGHVGLRDLAATAAGLGVQATHTSTGSPWLTCTATWACRPSRTTSTGGSTRRHGMSSTCAIARSIRSGDDASTPSAPSTPRSVAVLARRFCPWKSQWSGTTP